VIDGCWDVLGCVNQLRAGAGVAPLSASGALDAFAQNWADSLAATDTYRYSDSGPAGFAVWEEYIVAGYAQGNWVVEALAGSPTQLAGLLDPAYTQLGVGVAGPADDPYWCLELGG
jgi:uncharacterized protein YkwD